MWPNKKYYFVYISHKGRKILHDVFEDPGNAQEEFDLLTEGCVDDEWWGAPWIEHKTFKESGIGLSAKQYFRGDEF